MKQQQNNTRKETSKPATTDHGSIHGNNAVKNPDNWTTGDEPMTGAQQSYINTLAGEAGEEGVEDLTKAEASKKIEELQHKTGRGLDK